jgi:uncharacterized protein YbjT (DUF2867 family)
MKGVIFGATGMVGTEVLHECLVSDQFRQVVTIDRNASGLGDAKLTEIEHKNFHNFSSLESELSDADICFYCLGVYQGQVSKELFWEITVDYLTALIHTLEQVNKEITFCLFSAQGADPSERSLMRFSKAKGRAEKRLSESQIAKSYMFRPGFIMPGRKNPKLTFSIRAFKPIYNLFPSLGISASDLAKVMIHIGFKGSEMSVFENRDIRNIASFM